MEITRKLAYITNASLEVRDRGILMFNIWVDYEEGCSQCVGNFALDTYNETTKEREGTAYGCEMIRQILLELKVNDFCEMSGKHIWVLGSGKGLGFTPTGIQALKGTNKDRKAVIFSEVLEMFKERSYGV